jgi:hypothetical protein
MVGAPCGGLAPPEDPAYHSKALVPSLKVVKVVASLKVSVMV